MKATLGKRVKELREAYRLSQTDFSAQIGISYVALGNIERGVTENPQSDTINKLISKFGTTYEWLFEGKGDMFPNGIRELNQEQLDINRDFNPAKETKMVHIINKD